MTQEYREVEANDDPLLGRARALMIEDMALFITWAEANGAARRAVIEADEARCGIAAWLEIYEAGRDACLAIDARIACEAALSEPK